MKVVSKWGKQLVIGGVQAQKLKPLCVIFFPLIVFIRYASVTLDVSVLQNGGIRKADIK